MLMIFLLSQRGLDHRHECMILTSLDLMLLFRPVRTTLKKPHCCLKGLLTSRLSWTPTSLYGLHKVELNQPSCWLYYVPNLLVIQHLETLYLGGNHVRVVCERVWRKAEDCALNKGLATGSRGLQVAKGWTWVKHAEKLNSHASWSTIGQKVQSSQSRLFVL